MATNVSYPGVYIKEVPSGVRTIAGVPTSVAAFVGYTARGPVDHPVQIFSFADFERRFGGLDLDSDLSYAVQHFFLNGGGTAWIVRVAAGAKAAAIGLKDEAGGNVVLTAAASAAGAWGNGLQVTVDYDTSNPASLFNLIVEEVQDKNGARQVVRSEAHRNLSMNSSAANYAVNVVNAGSQMIRLERPTGVGSADKGTSESGTITDDIAASLDDDARRLGDPKAGLRHLQILGPEDAVRIAQAPILLGVADLGSNASSVTDSSVTRTGTTRWRLQVCGVQPEPRPV